MQESIQAPRFELFSRATVNLGAQGALPVFTVTGQVLVRAIFGIVTVTGTGASSTAALGVTGSTALFIAATTVTGMTTTNLIWASATPTAAGLALPAACKDIIIAANVIITIATADATAGQVLVVCHWEPVTANGNVV